jgi:hypothetical protein
VESALTRSKINFMYVSQPARGATSSDAKNFEGLLKGCGLLLFIVTTCSIKLFMCGCVHGWCEFFYFCPAFTYEQYSCTHERR